jgi:hypothetical protein
VVGIDGGRVLSRLVNMQFVRRDAGRYYLHPVDREYALSRLSEGHPDDRKAEIPPLTRFALRHRTAEWFKLAREPREAWKTLDDLAAPLAEFELRCAGEDYDTAAAVLLEFDFGYLLFCDSVRNRTGPVGTRWRIVSFVSSTTIRSTTSSNTFCLVEKEGATSAS